MAVTEAPAWVRRAEPLPAVAVTCRPDAVPHLLDAVAAALRAGATLQLAAAPAGCIVLGEDLPWFPGAVYLGADSGVLTPTTHHPVPAADLIGAWVRGRVPPECELVAITPWAVLAAPRPLRPVDPDQLEAVRRDAAADRVPQNGSRR